jgi:protein-disulfide isomerase
MEDRLTYFCVLTAMILMCSSPHLQPFQAGKMVALGDETHQETAEEHDREQNSNVQNGFSPARPSSNIAESVNKVQNNTLSISSLMAQGSPIFGNQSAPITVVEFGDFQCHFCGRFAINVYIF